MGNKFTREQVIKAMEQRIKPIAENYYDEYCVKWEYSEHNFNDETSLVELLSRLYKEMRDEKNAINLLEVHSETRKNLSQEQKENIQHIYDNYEVIYYYYEGGYADAYILNNKGELFFIKFIEYDNTSRFTDTLLTMEEHKFKGSLNEFIDMMLDQYEQDMELGKYSED